MNRWRYNFAFASLDQSKFTIANIIIDQNEQLVTNECIAYAREQAGVAPNAPLLSVSFLGNPPERADVTPEVGSA